MKCLRLLKDLLFYALFPNVCIFCGKIIGLHGTCCSACAKNLPYTRVALCSGCAKEPCVCARESFSYDRVVVPFYYTGAVRRAILRYKFANATDYAAAFAVYMADKLLSCTEAAQTAYISFMPATKRETRRRGYNQARLLAESLSKITGFPCVPLAQKARETKRQHRLDAKARRQNVKNAFRACPEVDVKGKTVILCDDVLTTGSSMNELARTLKAAGAKTVIACVVATVNR